MSSYKVRVLVVDDLPDVRATLAGWLSDEGYQVRSASNQAEALQWFNAERFHVAVIDVRLDDSDATNWDGLKLMHEIKSIDPSTAIIMLTGYATVKMVQAALQLGSNGQAPAFGFLEKSEFTQVPAWVSRAFQQAVGIDPNLEIQDLEEFLPALSKKIRFISTPKPPNDQLLEESEELLRKLFSGCKQIQIRPMRRGYSSVAVFEIIPWYRENEQGEALIAKIGDPVIIDNEVKRYKQFVQGMVGGHRLPTALEVKRTRSLAGVLYTFAGLGNVVEFAHFYAEARKTDIVSIIENLFLETCFPKRLESANYCSQADLRPVFMPLLRLNEKKLKTCLRQTSGGRHPFAIDVDNPRFLIFNQKTSMLNPVLFALSADLHADYAETTIHGDLHGHNILIDRRHETWLIDFANVCKGPLLQDYAALETFLRVSLVECEDWDILQAWERTLFNATNLWDITLSADITKTPAIKKAHAAILKMRQIAFEQHPCDTERVYLISLLFNALKAFTVMDLPAIQRDHALLSAALISEKLAKIKG